MKTWMRACAVILALLLVASACGDDDDTTEASADPTEDATDDGEATEEPTEEPTDDSEADDGGATEAPTEEAGATETAGEDGEATGATPAQGGSIVYGTYGEVPSLDPIYAIQGGCCGSVQMYALYGALMRRDPDTGEIVPYMAEDLTTEDAQTWTLTLRPDVTFTDGEPFDAEAVVYNLERMASNDAGTGVDQARLIESMEAVDDLTVEFTLVQPFVPFAYYFTRGLTSFGSPAAIEAAGDDFGVNPVGAGPFMLVDWSVDDRMVVERNPDYLFADEGKPYLDEITFRPIPDGDQRINSLIVGEVDLAYTRTPAEAQKAIDEGFDAELAYGGMGNFFQFNTRLAPMDDVRVRRAVAMALDYEAMNEVVYDGLASTSRQIAANDSPWYVPDLETYDYDPDASRALVEEYEAENGDVSFSYIVYNDPAVVQLAEFLQASLDEVGIDMEIDVVEITEFLDVVQTQPDGWETSQYGAAAWDDPSTRPYEGLAPDSGRNPTGYQNERLQELFDGLAATTDFDERYALWVEIEEIVAEELPIIVEIESLQALLFDGAEIGGIEQAVSSDLILMTDLIWRVE